GTVRVSSPVKEFKVAAGEVTGVVLESGEEILAAKAVVTSLDTRQIFPDMVKGADLPKGFVGKVRRIISSDYSALNSAYALNEAPRYKAGGDVDKSLWVEFSPDDLEHYLRGFENFRYGITATDFPIAMTHTLFDKTRAPEGKHTLYLYHYQPYDLKDGGAAKWDEIGEEVADGILETMRRHTTNMGDENIIGKRWFMTPLDIERYNPAMVRGDVSHAASMLAPQDGANRPIPGYGQYRLPIKKFYLTGASAHPGAGISGGGRAAAMVIMEDLGIDFEKVVA
ncbi:MAG: NAD(P)/FAD-dependent oxidoreductase, partial [Deltaproteobacteria bacterium]|nr:NAD(P)/FAD-dependent oxidoreductase [Deltaproteobacteria bacterium]